MIPDTLMWSLPSEGNAYIPTIGNIATAHDAYRIAGVAEIRHAPKTWSFTDIESVAALGRIIDGPISTGYDIIKAESALRSILLYEFTDIIIPCAKIDSLSPNGRRHLSYTRFDQSIRNQASFEAFRCTQCRDYLLTTEVIKVNNDLITESSFSGSKLINEPITSHRKHLNYLSRRAAEISTALPTQLGAFTHYSSPIFTAVSDVCHEGFINEIYQRIYHTWMNTAQLTPQLHVNLKLPPLLAIVLHRAMKRENIPEVLNTIREEMSPIRDDLYTMNLKIDSSEKQSEIYSFSKKMTESFNAIVPEALLTPQEIRSRRIMSVFNFIKPVPQLYSIIADPLSVDKNKLEETFSSIKSAVKKDRRIVSRNVSSTKFSELLRIGSVRDTILAHFNKSEIQLISEKAGN